MKRILFYILTKPFLFLLSLLPFFILYLFSDFLYLLVYKLFGYRKKVVRKNLKNSFPEKSEKELFLIEKKYYRYLCDLLVEVVKLITISPAQLKKRCVVENLELFDQLLEKHDGVVAVMGHFGNWEWSAHGFALRSKNPLFALYKRVRNPEFDKFLLDIRSRFGTGLIEMNDTVRAMVGNRKSKSVTAFIADQTPAPANAYWTTFLNQDTPVFKGTEKIATKFKYPVVFTSSRRVGRGRYVVTNELLCEHPKELAAQELTNLHTRKLEAEIRNMPHTWLWSHKRWKHSRK